MQIIIRVKGHLDLHWQEWFENLEIVHSKLGFSLMIGTLQDEAALYRVLLNIHQLGLVLLSLETLRPSTTTD